MWKKILIGATVLVIAGSSFVYAQHRFRGPGGPRWMPSADDMSAFTDARVAGMRAGLKLTPDQDKNWPAFEAAYRNLAQLRTDRINAMRDRRPPGGPAGPGARPGGPDGGGPDAERGNMMEFMQRRADAMTRGATAFKQFTDATAPLYQSLDDAQKRRFAILAQVMRPHGRSGAGPGRGFGPDRMGPGGDRPGFNRGPDGRRFGERGFDRDRDERGLRDEQLFTGIEDDDEFTGPALAAGDADGQQTFGPREPQR